MALPQMIICSCQKAKTMYVLSAEDHRQIHEPITLMQTIVIRLEKCVDCYAPTAIMALGSFKMIKNLCFMHITIQRTQKMMNKNFDITNTIDVGELAKRWGVTKKTIDNRRYRGQGPSYFKIGGKIKYDLDDVRRMENESYIETG